MRFSSCRRRDLNLFNVPSPMKRHHQVFKLQLPSIARCVGFFVLSSAGLVRRVERRATHEQKAPQAVFGQSPRLILLSLNPLHRVLRNVTEFSFVVDGHLFSEKDVYGFLGQSPRLLCNCTNTPPDSSLLFPKSRKKSHFFTKSKNMSYILYTSPGAMSIKMRFY